jgi:NADH-quinone oxidoreductase subunit L
MAYVIAIPLLPALAFAIMAPLSRTARNRLVPLSVAAVTASLVLSAMAFLAVWPGGHAGEPAYHASAVFALVGDTALSASIALEPLSAIMLLVVTIVGFGVQIYSLGYMHREERIGWYYTVLSLFTAAMLLLVLADNFLLLFMSWEIMGLCS